MVVVLILQINGGIYFTNGKRHLKTRAFFSGAMNLVKFGNVDFIYTN